LLRAAKQYAEAKAHIRDPQKLKYLANWLNEERYLENPQPLKPIAKRETGKRGSRAKGTNRKTKGAGEGKKAAEGAAKPVTKQDAKTSAGPKPVEFRARTRVQHAEYGLGDITRVHADGFTADVRFFNDNEVRPVHRSSLKLWFNDDREIPQ
jgi:hypothetical protein